MKMLNGLRRTASLCVGAALCLALAACGGGGDKPLEPTGTVPAGGEALGRQLTVIFNAPLAAGLDRNTSAPLVFDPPTSGTFQYGPNYIGFEPVKWWPDGVLEVRPAPWLRSATGAAPGAGAAPLTLTSFAFEPQQLWNIDTYTTGTLLGLSFNSDVDRASVGRLGELTDRLGKSVPFEALPGLDAQTVRLKVAANVDWPLALRLPAGVREAKGRFATPWAKTLRTTAPSHPQISLDVTDLSWANVAPGAQRLAIEFSSRFDSAQLKDHLKLTDISTTAAQPLDFTIEPTVQFTEGRQTNFISFAAPVPEDVKVRVEVTPGMRSATGLEMIAPYKNEMAARTQLEINSDYWMTREPQGLALNLILSYQVEMADFRSHFEIDPPLAGMELVQTGTTRYEVRGQWEPQTTYRMRLTPGVPFVGWARTRQPLDRYVTTPKELPPYLGMPEVSRYYMPRRYGDKVPIETRGLGDVTVRLYKMFPSNLPVAADQINDGRVGWELTQKWSSQVGERTLKLDGASNTVVKTLVSLDALTSGPQLGVFCMEVQSDRVGVRSRLVLRTNLGVLAHWQAGEAVVFVHDLFSLAPVAGARVTIYSDKNQLLGTAATDARGLAHLTGFDPALGRPGVAVVENGTRDYTFLDLTNSGDARPAFNYAMPPYDPKDYDAFLYADRELYRPGETVHLRWIVRRQGGGAVAGAPFILSVIKPNGRELLTRPVALGELGTAGLDVTTQHDYPTGAYRVVLKIPGSDTEIGSYGFQLEEFVPNRMKVAMKIPDPLWVAGGAKPRVVMTAEQLFGGPAVGRRASAEVTLRSWFSFKEWPQFQFGNDRPVQLNPLPLGDVATDAQGQAVFEFNTPTPGGLTHPLSAHVSGRVTELGGRAVQASADAAIFPSDLCLGIAGEPGDKDGEVQIRVAAVRPDGRPADLGEVQVTLEKQKWDYNVRRYATNYEAQFSGDYREVETRTLALRDGVTSTTFTAPDFGYYRVRVHSPRTVQFSTLSFYSYGGRARISRGAEQSLIKLQLDKPSYTVGEKARLRIESPFDGHAIVVVQGGAIQRVIPADVRDGVAEVTLDVTQAMVPNVWIEATVIHAIEQGKTQVYPFSSFAMTGLKAVDTKRALSVSLPGLPEEVKPAQHVSVTVETRDAAGRPAPAEVTLAAVDEGIHSITGYQNPDPVAHFARERRPDFGYAHYYDKISDDFTAPAPGGDGSAVASRLGHAPQNWIRTVALWSGAVRTGPDGRATIDLDVPEFNGQLRLVAVAADATATGMVSARLYVRRPWILQTSMPRFMLPGDRAELRATVANTSATSCTVELTTETSGTLALDAPTSPATRVIAPHGEASVLVGVRAAQRTGPGGIRWSAKITGPDGAPLQTLSEDDALPVLPPAAYESHWTVASIDAGTSRTFDTADFVQDDLSELTLTVGASPLIRLQKVLADLVGYPYGCVEQTTSRMLPIYLLRKNTGLLQAAGQKTAMLDSYLRAGIDRLFSMQTASGGLAFWPGSNTPYPYGSIYALHFLTLVHEGREMAIDPNNYAILREYVRGLARDATDRSLSGLYQRAYATYVLALGGDREALETIARFDSIPMPRAGRYLLAAALALGTRDTDRVALYLRNAPMVDYDARLSDGTLNSPARNKAVELLSLVRIGGDRAAMGRLANELTGHLEGRSYGTTQEKAFVIAALGTYLDALDADAPGTASLAGAAIAWPGGEAALRGTEMFQRKLSGAGARFTVRNTGQAPLYVTSVARGVPTSPPTEPVADGITLARRVLDRQGNPTTTFEQGRSYVVELTIGCERELKQVVVTDLLPAGLEIENPRLDRDAMSGVSLPYATVSPSHLEMRDDRLVLVFDRLGRTGGSPSEQHHLYYVVNAVTPGTFTEPGLAAECMYDPVTRAATLPTTVEVRP